MGYFDRTAAAGDRKRRSTEKTELRKAVVLEKKLEAGC